MLHFFRKYQKYFFIIVTVFTVFSFVFFGTYQAFAPSHEAPDEAVFRTVDGKNVMRSAFHPLCRFLSVEAPASGTPQYRPFLGNYLNDGVISKDFFETRLAYPLVKAFEEVMTPDLLSRSQREKNYTPYSHPYAKFLSADTVWSLFAPDIKEGLAKLQMVSSPAEESAFQARMNLYLAEKRFPSSLLAQVLRYQEKEYKGLPSDPRLYREELSLFGYHDLQDWFGPTFVEGVAQFVLNTAAVAKQKGYKVTSEEALTDLLLKSEKAFQAVKDVPNLSARSGQEFFQQYLRYMQMDELTMIKLWQEILLFRRVISDVGASALIDAHAFSQFFSEAKEYATVELYQMAPEYRFQNGEELKQFEAYLRAVSSSYKGALTLPQQLDSIDIIEKRAPELVGQKYVLEVGQVTKKGLQAKVTLKETWEWETASENWDLLKQEFPELALGDVTDEQSRFDRLEQMDKKGRALVDQFARAQIVEAHPEWLESALSQTELKERVFFIRSKHLGTLLEGISEVSALKTVLDQSEKIEALTQDQETFYRIIVKERAPKEVVTFAEAKKENLLDTSTVDCTTLVNALYQEALKRGEKLEITEENKMDVMAPYRFVSYLKESHDKEAVLWKVVKKCETLSRSTPSFISLDSALAMKEGEYSPLAISKAEGAYFFKFMDKKVDTTIPIDKMLQAQTLLETEAKSLFMNDLLKEFCDRGAMVLKAQNTQEGQV